MDVVVVLLVAGVALLLYWLVQLRCLLQLKGVPFLIPIPFVGSFRVLTTPFMDPLEMTIEMYRKNAKIHSFLAGPVLTVCVGDPELIRLITVKDTHIFTNRFKFPAVDKIASLMLFTARDDDWKRIRSAITPTFSSGKMKQMIYMVNDCADSLIQNIREHVERKQLIDVKSLIGAFTMDVICTTSFSTRVDSHKDPNNPIVENAKNFFTNEIIRYITPLLVMFPETISLLVRIIPSIKFFDTTFFQTLTKDVLEKRRKLREAGKAPPVDFLNLMIEAQENFEKERKRSFSEEDNQNVSPNFVISNKLTEDEMFAQCVQFFTVGFDTTATTISFALHHLAIAQDHQDRLSTEIEEGLAQTEGQVTYDLVKRIPFLEAVVSETLRLYPAAPTLDREASEDYTLGDTGVTLPKGTDVQIPIAGIHRDPDYFPDPEKFVPERFLPENRDSINPYAYMPFGSGPRICVANRFAMMEAKVGLTHLIHNFRFFYPPGIKKELTLRKGLFLLQPHNYYLAVEERSPKKTV